MQIRMALAAMLVGALGVTGCGSDDEPDNSDNKASGATSDANQPPTPTQSESFSPDVGDRALKIGQPREGRSIVTTVEEVKAPYPPKEYYDADPGEIWVGLRVKQCLRDGVVADDGTLTAYEAEFALVAPDGDEYPGSDSSWPDWPEPRFPTTSTMTPGKCVKGWMTISYPKGKKVASVLWRPGGTTTAEWIVQ